jgi:hypothetical protein
MQERKTVGHTNVAGRFGFALFLLAVIAFTGKDVIKKLLSGNSHKEVVVKTMQPWGDDSRTCQFFNGNPAVVGGPRTMKEGDHLEMHCESGTFIDGDWRYTYVGTVKLDDASQREFDSKDKYFVNLLCTRNGKTFECFQPTSEK